MDSTAQERGPIHGRGGHDAAASGDPGQEASISRVLFSVFALSGSGAFTFAEPAATYDPQARVFRLDGGNASHVDSSYTNTPQEYVGWGAGTMT